MKRRNEGIYALYKGDKFITEGTKKQIAKCIGVKVNTISYYATKAYEKRMKQYNHKKGCKILIRID
jgi:hypothetical protein